MARQPFVVAILLTALTPTSLACNPAGPSGLRLTISGPNFSETVTLRSTGATAELIAQASSADWTVPRFLTSEISWSSSNTAVVTVSAAGVVTAKAPGQATITGKYFSQTDTVNVTVDLSRVVPIYLDAWSCSACPQPQMTATFEGRTLTEGYNVFNLNPGSYELIGTLLPSNRAQLDDRDRWDIAFTTFSALGSPPPISDNGVELASITSEAGPAPTFNRSECSVFYHVPDKSSPQFRIRFRVTDSRTTGVTCPVKR